ncbi:MAG TPA: glycosyltransferase family 1 protein [Chloroflexi bacterium]|nr:glycosyltransferase family 1 protein [Chloroflexota bacterium]
MITGKDILILSTQDWDALPTRKHHWARKLASRGNRVVYVEQQMHILGWLADIGNHPKRLWSWMNGPRIVADGLWVFTLPIVLPFFQVFRLVNSLNNVLLSPIIRWALLRIGFDIDVLWVYTPHSAGLIGRLGEEFVVYECVDDFTATRGLVRSSTIGALEQDLLSMVDQVIVTHAGLQQAKSGISRRLALIPNGADLKHFSLAVHQDTVPPKEVSGLPKPVIGFHGWIQYWIDFDLIAYAARKRPDWSFVFIGPIEPLARVNKVRSLSNVHFLGKMPYANIPALIAGFDVCINPFVIDKLSDTVSPIKLYEYLASGKPVVSVDMPAAREFADLISIVHTPGEFVSALEEQINSNEKETVVHDMEARQKAVANYSWDARFKQVEDVVGNSMVSKAET